MESWRAAGMDDFFTNQILATPAGRDGPWQELAGRIAAGPVFGAPASLEQRIDRAIARLCPCGAEPSPDHDPYCSDDCRPTHRAAHTDQAQPGAYLATPMRWRPDLVSAIDDSGMTELTERELVGDIFRQAWLREDGRTVHLRVDDGYRFAGTDITYDSWVAGGIRLARRWRALRRELGNAGSLEPALPDGDLPITGRLGCISPMAGFSTDRLAELVQMFESGARQISVRVVATGISCPGCPACAGEPPEQDPAVLRRQRAELLDRLRDRGTGPQIPRRAPGRIDPHGMRT